MKSGIFFVCIAFLVLVNICYGESICDVYDNDNLFSLVNETYMLCIYQNNATALANLSCDSLDELHERYYLSLKDLFSAFSQESLIASQEEFSQYLYLIILISEAGEKCNFSKVYGSFSYSSENVDFFYTEEIDKMGRFTPKYYFSFVPDKEVLRQYIESQHQDDSSVYSFTEYEMEKIHELSSDKIFYLRVIFGDLFTEDIVINGTEVSSVPLIIDTYGDVIDVTIEISFDSFYSFLAGLGKSPAVKAPYWYTESDGFGAVTRYISQVSTFWRTGISIKPRYKMMHVIMHLESYLILVREIL
jgi:hypothetical protein